MQNGPEQRKGLQRELREAPPPEKRGASSKSIGKFLVEGNRWIPRKPSRTQMLEQAYHSLLLAPQRREWVGATNR